MQLGKPDEISFGEFGFNLITRVDRRGQIALVRTYVDGAWLFHGDVYGMLQSVHRRDERRHGPPFADDPGLSLW